MVSLPRQQQQQQPGAQQVGLQPPWLPEQQDPLRQQASLQEQAALVNLLGSPQHPDPQQQPHQNGQQQQQAVTAEASPESGLTSPPQQLLSQQEVPPAAVAVLPLVVPADGAYQTQQQQTQQHSASWSPSVLPLVVPAGGGCQAAGGGSTLSRDELKEAKTTASSLVKARLAVPYSQGLISKELFAAAAKAVTHGLYEKVKAGELQLQDLAGAAACVRGGAGEQQGGAAAMAAAEVVHVTDLLLAEAGVEVG